MQLTEEGDYFSEESIKHRAPILHHMYLGRFVRSGGTAPDTFYDILLNQVQSYETDREVAELLEANPILKPHLKPVDKELSKEEQEENEDELIVLMHHRFLAGMDVDFIDYSLIDSNE